MCVQSSEKKAESSDTEAPPESENTDSPTNQVRGGGEMGGAGAEQPFIKLSQEEYGEHHSSIMHCR